MTWRCCGTAGWAGSSPTPYAPSTLGSFLRSFTFGHVRQLDAVASRFLTGLAAQTPLLGCVAQAGERVLVDIDDTIIEVHGYAKQGSGFGYSGVRGLNALLATVTTDRVGAGDRGPAAAEGIVRLPARRGPAGRRRPARPPASSPGRARRRPLVRADSAFYGHPTVGAAVRGRRRRLGHRPHGPRRSRPRSPPSPTTRGPRSSTPTRSSTRQTGTLDLPGRGRRDPVHRVHLQEEGRAGPRPAGGAPDPRPQPRRRTHGQDDAVRHLAVPRLLHHHRPRRRSTPSPRTRPTAGTRSSSRSTPT